MKRFLSIVLVLISCFALFACESETDTTTTSSESTTATTTTNSATTTVPQSTTTTVAGGEETTTVVSGEKTTTAVGGATTTTAKNDTTTKPVTQTTTTPVQSAPQLKVLDMAFEEIYLSNANIICGKRNGRYGAVDINGKIIVPFEYDYIYSPTTDGYVLAIKDGSSAYEYKYYLFNSSGRVTYQSTANVSYEHLDYDLVGEEVLQYNEGVLLTRTNSDGNYIGASYTLNLRKADGTLIKSFDNVMGYSGFTNGYLAISINRYPDFDEPDVLIVNSKGNILYSKNTGLSSLADYPIIEQTVFKGIAGGYFFVQYKAYPDQLLISIDLTKYYRFVSWFGSSEHFIEHYGTKTIFETESASYILVDITKATADRPASSIPSAVISKYDYDYMSFASEFGNTVKYALVSRNNKWGYLSLDGKTEKLYDDAGSFYGGKAIVKQGNEIFIINENFEKVSASITGYDTVSTLGKNIYALKKGNVYYPAMLTK